LLLREEARESAARVGDLVYDAVIEGVHESIDRYPLTLPSRLDWSLMKTA
jgi:hypothetical protein